MSTRGDFQRASNRLANRHAKKSTDPVSWCDVPAKIIVNLIDAASRAGGAIRFGDTRDHGAFALGVYGDGEPYTEYFRSSSELEEFATELINVFNGMADKV